MGLGELTIGKLDDWNIIYLHTIVHTYVLYVFGLVGMVFPLSCCRSNSCCMVARAYKLYEVMACNSKIVE